jgi:hypothetical protein
MVYKSWPPTEGLLGKSLNFEINRRWNIYLLFAGSEGFRSEIVTF